MTTISDDAFVRLFQERFGLSPIDGWAGKDTLAKLDEIAPPKVVPSDASAIPEDYWPMLSRIESADRPYAQAASSSASGLYQFIRSTWIGEGGKWGVDAKGNAIMRPAFGGLKPTPAEQLARAKTFTAKNAAHLRKAGIPINRASLYAAHFFGKVTAAAVIAADVRADAAAIAGPAATKANRTILQRQKPDKTWRNATVGEFLTWLHGKTGEWAR